MSVRVFKGAHNTSGRRRATASVHVHGSACTLGVQEHSAPACLGLNMHLLLASVFGESERGGPSVPVRMLEARERSAC